MTIFTKDRSRHFSSITFMMALHCLGLRSGTLAIAACRCSARLCGSTGPCHLSLVVNGRSPGQAHGMGMGLSIVRTIVDAHNGHIVAENQAGGGSVFRVTLPLAKMHGNATDLQVKAA